MRQKSETFIYLVYASEFVHEPILRINDWTHLIAT